MNLSLEIILILLAYLIGSIPTSVWIGRLFYGIDVREFGSGNAGATNTFRVLGKKAGIPVLMIDILKGFIAVLFACFSDLPKNDAAFVNLQLALGIASVVGHIFPVFEGFRGGKGVATLLGVVLAVQPESAFISVMVFTTVLVLFRYVSVASMAAGLVYPISVIFIHKTEFTSLIAFSILVAFLLIITHKRNIERLLKKQETKVTFFSFSKK
jgi:glycerol-3-phosphate acyltransferase PlsY